MLNKPAASAAPVPPAHTNACARPCATARAAWTIEASGFARAALAGSGLLAIDSGASTTCTLAAGSPSSAAGPNRITRAPRLAAIAAPAATSAGPRSAPLQSTATTGWSEASARTGIPADATPALLVIVLVIVAVAAGRHDIATGIG